MRWTINEAANFDRLDPGILHDVLDKYALTRIWFKNFPHKRPAGAGR